jgi:hypothetical protein
MSAVASGARGLFEVAIIFSGSSPCMDRRSRHSAGQQPPNPNGLFMRPGRVISAQSHQHSLEG